MIFNPKPLSINIDILWIEQASNEATALLFGGKAFSQQIDSRFYKPATRFGGIKNSVGLAGVGFGPMNGATVEMASIEQRHGSLFGLLTDGFFESEIHY